MNTGGTKKKFGFAGVAIVIVSLLILAAVFQPNSYSADQKEIIKQSAKALSSIKKNGIDGMDVIQLTTADARKLFGKPTSTEKGDNDDVYWLYGNDMGLMVTNDPKSDFGFVTSIYVAQKGISVCGTQVGEGFADIAAKLVDDGFRTDEKGTDYRVWSLNNGAHDIALVVYYDGAQVITGLQIGRRIAR